jgi:hypothetical protein
MREALGLAAGLIALLIYIPYALDITKGRVVPARSTRVMLALVLIVVLAQQLSIGGGWATAVTVGELIGSFAILSLSFKYGMGGLTHTDKVCYGLFAVSLAAWLLSGNGLLALHFSIAADFVAFAPTLIKTWRLPNSETPLFYIIGTFAAGLSAVAGHEYSYAVLLFPLYLVLVNLVQLAIMYRQKILASLG